MNSADVAERGSPRALFRNQTMDFLASWLLGYAQQGGLSPGTLLDAFARIRDGDPGSWCATFGRVAEATGRRATEAEAAGRSDEASRGWLGVAVAQRARLSLLDPRTAEAREATAALTSSFASFLRLGGIPLEAGVIPLGAGLLPAYWSLELASAERLVIVLGGGDTHVQDLWFFGGRALTRAGWPVLLVDLPGQGATPDQGLHFGPATLEGLVRTMDFVRERGFGGEIVLLGWSSGGLFVTKYASIARPSDRLRAVVASAPIHDMERLFRRMLPRVMRSDPDRLATRAVLALARRNRVLRVALAGYQWQFGPGGIAGALSAFADLGRTDLAAIDVPVLALVGSAEDEESRRQAEEVVAALRERHPASTLVGFDKESGASAHCQVGNLPLALDRIIAWLDGLF